MASLRCATWMVVTCCDRRPARPPPSALENQIAGNPALTSATFASLLAGHAPAARESTCVVQSQSLADLLASLRASRGWSVSLAGAPDRFSVGFGPDMTPYSTENARLEANLGRISNR